MQAVFALTARGIDSSHKNTKTVRSVAFIVMRDTYNRILGRLTAGHLAPHYARRRRSLPSSGGAAMGGLSGALPHLSKAGEVKAEV